jgi:hypothetical protein
VLFHFSYRFEDRWEEIGCGEGAGIEAPAVALAELNGLSGGCLLAGTYRCIAASASSGYWEYLELGPDGAIGFAEEELLEDEEEAPAESLSLSARSHHGV